MSREITQCPRQDSNLRSRLRRAWHHPALTSANVLAGDPSGHALGTGRIAAGHGLAGRHRWFARRVAGSRASLTLHLESCTGPWVCSPDVGRLAGHPPPPTAPAAATTANPTATYERDRPHLTCASLRSRRSLWAVNGVMSAR